MILLAELWFLVSTAILHFANWRCRKKKLFQCSIQLSPSHPSWFVNFLRFLTLVLVVPTCFSYFSSLNTNSSYITDAEFRPGILFAHSTLADKTFCQQTSCKSFKIQVSNHFTNMVSTETVKSSLSRHHWKNSNTALETKKFFQFNLLTANHGDL